MSRMKSAEAPVSREATKRWAALSVAWLLVTPLAVTAIAWDGMRTRELTHHELLDAIRTGDNRAAAIEAARHRALQIIDAIRAQADREGRDGLAARIALDYFRQEAVR